MSETQLVAGDGSLTSRTRKARGSYIVPTFNMRVIQIRRARAMRVKCSPFGFQIDVSMFKRSV
jgi:hypothetical protein